MCEAALDVSRAPETRVSGPSSARICDSEPRYWPNACAPVGGELQDRRQLRRRLGREPLEGGERLLALGGRG